MSIWFITGASRGLGAEITRAALARGHQVVAAARDAAQVRAAFPDAGDALVAVPLDVTDPARIDAAVHAATDRFGGIDVLVNNVGRGLLGAVEQSPGAPEPRGATSRSRSTTSERMSMSKTFLITPSLTGFTPMADDALAAHRAGPPGCVSWEKAYPGSPATVSHVRRDVRAILGPCPEAVADDVELVVSELATNAIRHSRSGADGGTYLVRIAHCVTAKVSYIWVEVRDQGNPSWDGILRPEPTHGLSVIEHLSTWMGSDDRPGGQRAVYARLDYRADGTRFT